MFPCPITIDKVYVIGYIESSDTDLLSIDVEFMKPVPLNGNFLPSDPQSTTTRQCYEPLPVNGLSIERSKGSVIPGFNKILLSFDEVDVPARSIVRLRHNEVLLLFQKQSTLASIPICNMETVTEGIDFPYIPLIHAEGGKKNDT